MNHFHVTLPSDASLDCFPQNTVAHFTTKLSQTIRLEGDYEVGLAEIIYPHSWYNVDNSTRQYWFGIRSDGREIKTCHLKSGYYVDGTVLANELSRQCVKHYHEQICR